MLDVLVSSFTDPKLWLIVLVWGAIMMLERWVVFHTSRRLGQAVLHDMPGLTQERQESIVDMAERWGSSALLLASIPLFGQVLTAIAGTGKASLVTFLILVGISYLVRNWIVVILSGEIVRAFL